jgi:16S rRNA (uracil1498-N3)-methyltransferase
VNLLLVDPGEIAGGRAVVTGRRARHAFGVLGARQGSALRVGVVAGGIGLAEVVAAAPARIEVAIGVLSEPPREPLVDLVLALPRPKVVPRVLQAAASMGVRRVDLINAWRVDKTYFSSHRVDPEALSRELWLGCEQGAHTYLPRIEVHPVLMPFLRGPLAERARRRRLLLFDPGARDPVERVVARGADEPVVALIGPEGGWIDREIAALEGIGAARVALGDRVLRTDVAVVSALAQLALLSRLR